MLFISSVYHNLEKENCRGYSAKVAKRKTPYYRFTGNVSLYSLSKNAFGNPCYNFSKIDQSHRKKTLSFQFEKDD